MVASFRAWRSSNFRRQDRLKLRRPMTNGKRKLSELLTPGSECSLKECHGRLAREDTRKMRVPHQTCTKRDFVRLAFGRSFDRHIPFSIEIDTAEVHECGRAGT